MTDPRYHYRCRLLDVIDGDTVELEVELGFHARLTVRVRLEGIDTPELKGKTHEERRRAQDAQALVAQWCEARADRIILRTVRDGRDKFGRLLATLIDQDSGQTVQQALIDTGLARPYDGQTKRQPWMGARATLAAGGDNAQRQVRQDGTRAGEGSDQERPDRSAT